MMQMEKQVATVSLEMCDSISQPKLLSCYLVIPAEWFKSRKWVCCPRTSQMALAHCVNLFKYCR